MTRKKVAKYVGTLTTNVKQLSQNWRQCVYTKEEEKKEKATLNWKTVARDHSVQEIGHTMTSLNSIWTKTQVASNPLPVKPFLKYISVSTCSCLASAHRRKKRRQQRHHRHQARKKLFRRRCRHFNNSRLSFTSFHVFKR